MPKTKKLVDTNILLRFLVADSPRQANKVEKLFKKAKKNELEITDFILTETVWTLLSYYQIAKNEVIEKLEGILSFEKFKLNRSVLKLAIDIYRSYNISFIDAYLCSLSKVGNYQGLYTFDKRLHKIPEIRTLKL